MKKIFSGILLLFMTLTAFAAQRTVEEAAALAAQFFNAQPAQKGIKRAPMKAASMRLNQQVAKPNSSEPALYVYNNPNGGWVIISADDNTATILGYSDKGTFDGTKSNVAYMLDYYAERIAKAQPLTDEQKAKRSARQAKAADFDTTRVAPLLEIEGIQWNQNSPWNDMCPIDRYDNSRSATGCVATAAAMVMRFWKWPAQGTGKYSYTWNNAVDYDEKVEHTLAFVDTVLTADFGATTYDWDNMLPQYQDKQYTTEQANAVALFMSHVGVASEMGYGGYTVGGSGANTTTIGYGMVKFFRYKVQGDYRLSDNFTYDSIAKYFSIDLHAGRPILMSGAPRSGHGSGHAFVCDGMKNEGETTLFHINWGWGGQSDGYFLIDILDPDKQGIGGNTSSNGFASGIVFMHGLEPDTLPNPVSAVALSEDNITLDINERKQLSAIITPAEACNKYCAWTSSDESIATVDDNGNVRGISTGDAVITATTYDGGLTATCNVTVTTVEGGNPEVLTFDYVFQQNKDENSQRFSFGFENKSQGEYPYMYIKFEREETNAIAGYYELDGKYNYIEGWPSAAKGEGYTTKSKSGWLRITCVGNKEYKFDTYFIGNDGLDYSFSYTTQLSIDLDDQSGDGNSREVKWYSLGEEYASNMSRGNRVVLPSNQPASCSNGRVFIGWSSEEVDATNIKPVLVRNNDLLNSNATYYAVFAEQTTSSVTSVEAGSVKFNNYTGDDDVDMSDRMDDMMAYDNKEIKKVGGTNIFVGKKGAKLGADELTGWITLTLDKPKAIKKVVIEATAFEGDQDCSIRVLAGRTMIDGIHTPAASMEYVAGEPVVSNTVKVAISEKRKHVYISKITVYEEENGTYSNYSTSCEGTATDSPIIVPVNNENLLITRDHINIDIDEYKPLVYTVAPYDKKSQSVTWTTSDPSVATVTSKGLVLGISNGTATITGTATDGGYTATCEVKVGGDAPEELVFTGMFENRVKSDNRISIGLYGEEGGYYPYMYFIFKADNTNWKIAGTYELNSQNKIQGWPSQASYNELGDNAMVASKSGWLNIACVASGIYRFQGQFSADDGKEYSFDYTGAIASINGNNLTDEAGDGALDYAHFVSMGDTIATTLIKNGKLALPSFSPSNCSTMTFVGWTAEENYNSDAAPTFAKAGDATSADATYYAVYAIKDGDPIVNAEVASVVFKDSQDANSWYDDDYIGNKQVTELMDSYNNITTLHGSWLRPGAHGVRIGGNAQDEYGQDHKGYVQLVMSGKEMISKVVITSSKAKDNDLGLLYIDLGSLHDDEPIVCGDNIEYIPEDPIKVNSVKVATGQLTAYVKAVTVYAEKQNYKNYTTTTCYDPTATAITNSECTKSEWTKVIENGVVYFIRGNEKLNIFGQKVK